MTNIPDSSPCDYSAVFYLEGIHRRFVYQVSKEASERIRESLEEETTGNLIFEAFRPAEQVVVNSRLIQLLQFQWDPVTDSELDLPGEADADDELDERTGAVSLYFCGREAPVELEVDDPEEVFDLLLAMETEAFPWCSVVDAEGEEAVFDLRKLACAEIPLGLTDRRSAQALFGLEEEA